MSKEKFKNLIMSGLSENILLAMQLAKSTGLQSAFWEIIANTTSRGGFRVLKSTKDENELANAISNTIRATSMSFENELPMNIGDFPNLQAVTILNNWRHDKPIDLRPLAKATKLKRLTLFKLHNDIVPDLSHMRELESLNFKFMRNLREVPDFLRTAKFPKLVELSFTGCPIKEIPTWIDELGKHRSEPMASLDFSQTQVRSIPYQLRELRLKSLSLSSLPAGDNGYGLTVADIERCLNYDLQSLNLDRSHIGQLPKFHVCPKLERLNVSYNKLESLPGTLLNDTSLWALEANNNEIKELPEITTLSNLVNADLSENQLSEYPMSWSGLELRTLKLAGNQNLDELYFGLSMGTLRQLDLRGTDMGEDEEQVKGLYASASRHDNAQLQVSHNLPHIY